VKEKKMTKFDAIVPVVELYLGSASV